MEFKSVVMNQCEFCAEFNEFNTSRVGRIYPDKPNRLVIETEHFNVVPTIGQLVNTMLMIVPKDHYERFADVPKRLLEELEMLILTIEKTLGANVILFEHGAKKSTGLACGIYHAHIHILPLISSFKSDILIGQGYSSYTSLHESFVEMIKQDNYIFYRDNQRNYYTNIPNAVNKLLFQSQYFRKWIVQHHKLERDYDWKNYNSQEKSILHILK